MSNSSMNVQNVASISTKHRFPWKWYLSDLDKVKKSGLKVFSCFSCGGGSSMGYKLAGYEVLGCCEIDPQMMECYKANNHPKYSYLMDIRDLTKEDLPLDLFDIDVLDGSPPCSTFSMAGQREEGWNKEKVFREGQKHQRLDDLFFAFIDVAKFLKPKVVVAENVKGLIMKNAKGYVNEIVRGFNEAGYDVQIFLLNASRMGVPQERERVFFVCRRKDLNYPKMKIEFREPLITFGEVREPDGIELCDGIQKELLALRIPTDNKVSDISNRVRRKNAGFTAPINRDDKPAKTITSGGSAFRMCDGKKMTKMDFVNCQTFPQDYDFCKSQPQYVCGMSVPPVMMANLAKEIELQIFKGKDNG